MGIEKGKKKASKCKLKFFVYGNHNSGSPSLIQKFTDTSARWNGAKPMHLANAIKIETSILGYGAGVLRPHTWTDFKLYARNQLVVGKLLLFRIDYSMVHNEINGLKLY